MSALHVFVILCISMMSCVTHASDVFWHYLGPLSPESGATVIEVYSDGLVSATLDVDSDGKLDYYVTIDDSGGHVGIVFAESHAIADHIKETPGNTYKAQRPDGFGPSALLERISAAASRQPQEQSLEALFAADSDETTRWVAALELRNGGPENEDIKLAVFQQLMDGNYPMQSSFVLTGYGSEGVKLLGKVLRDSSDDRAARDAAIYLAQPETPAKFAVTEIAESLDRDWINTRHCAMGALLHIAKTNPDLVEPFLTEIGKFTTHLDEDIKGKAQLIIDTVKNRKSEQGAAEQPATAVEPK